MTWVSMRSTRILCLLVLGLPLGLMSCSSSSEQDASAPCEQVHVDRLKELMVVEDSVVEDPRSKNATAGPWSFRFVIENLAPVGKDPGEFTRAWLDQWVSVKELNGVRLDRPLEERSGEMNRRI